MWSDRRPASFDALIYFRRPIFWDEAVQVGAIEDGPNWRSLGLLKLPIANADPTKAAEPTGEAVAKEGTELALQSYTVAQPRDAQSGASDAAQGDSVIVRL